VVLNPDLQLDLLRDREGVIHLDPEIANGALQLRMAEQQLYRPQVAGLLVDLRRLRST
jgi:DICT domain-containing protein